MGQVEVRGANRAGQIGGNIVRARARVTVSTCEQDGVNKSRWEAPLSTMRAGKSGEQRAGKVGGGINREGVLWRAKVEVSQGPGADGAGQIGESVGA